MAKQVSRVNVIHAMPLLAAVDQTLRLYPRREVLLKRV
jgi:hypothetical protein